MNIIPTYINKCPKCGTYMFKEIRFDKNCNSYHVFKCVNSYCGYEMEVNKHD